RYRRRAPPIGWFAISAGTTASNPLQSVLHPVPHLGAAQREVVALAVLGAAFFRREDAQRLVRRAAGRVQRLGVAQRNLLVVGAVHQEKRAAHLLHHAVETERLEPPPRRLQRVDAAEP